MTVKDKRFDVYVSNAKSLSTEPPPPQPFKSPRLDIKYVKRNCDVHTLLHIFVFKNCVVFSFAKKNLNRHTDTPMDIPSNLRTVIVEKPMFYRTLQGINILL